MTEPTVAVVTVVNASLPSADDRAPNVSNDAAPPDRRRRAVIGATVLLIAVVYLAAALNNGKTFRSSPTPIGFHAAAADALLRGDAALFKAPEGVDKLEDPYDPVANLWLRQAGAHDLALYKGNFYITTGPTTALLFHVPGRLLGLGNLNPNLVTLLAGFGGFVASIGVFAELRRRYFPRLPIFAESLTIVGLGVGSPLLWLVSIGRTYESAIACGFLCVTTGVYFLLRALHAPARPVRWMLAVSGAALAAAVGARAHLAAAGIFVAIAVVVIWRARPGDRAGDHKSALRSLLWLLVPYFVVGIGIALYNYVRFDSFTEFGPSYQLAGFNMREYEGYRTSYIGPNLVDYLLLRPRFGLTWPYVLLEANTSANNPFVHSREPVAGVVWLYPFIGVGVIWTMVRWSVLWKRQRELARLLLLGLAFAALALLAVTLPFNASTMRYTVDFAPALAMVAAVGWSASYTSAPARARLRILLASTWALAIVASATMSIALLLTPCIGTGSC